MTGTTPAAAAANPATLRVRDLATMLQVCERTVWRLSDLGLIPGRIKVGRSVRWNAEAIRSWIERGCPRSRGR